MSVENTEHNCTLNGISNVKIKHGDVNVVARDNALYDVVVANINRNILLADMPSLRQMMKSGSIILMSGFYESDTKDLIDKAQILGLEYVTRKMKNEWCMVKMRCK